MGSNLIVDKTPKRPSAAEIAAGLREDFAAIIHRIVVRHGVTLGKIAKLSRIDLARLRGMYHGKVNVRVDEMGSVFFARDVLAKAKPRSNDA